MSLCVCEDSDSFDRKNRSQTVFFFQEVRLDARSIARPGVLS